MLNADYQFDNDDKTLPVWKVSFEDSLFRNSGHPFYKKTVYSRAKTRKEAIEKVQSYFSSNHDRFRASKVS